MRSLRQAFGVKAWTFLCKALLGLLAVFGAVEFLFPIGKLFASALIWIIKGFGIDPAQPGLLIMVTALTVMFLAMMAIGLVSALLLQIKER